MSSWERERQRVVQCSRARFGAVWDMNVGFKLSITAFPRPIWQVEPLHSPWIGCARCYYWLLPGSELQERSTRSGNWTLAARTAGRHGDGEGGGALHCEGGGGRERQWRRPFCWSDVQKYLLRQSPTTPGERAELLGRFQVQRIFRPLSIWNYWEWSRWIRIKA